MSIAKNIEQIKAELAEVNKKTQLVAVSKKHSAEAVREAIAAGQRIFGENRVQEAQEKFPELKAEFTDLQLHLIGPLQTNKVKDALALFDVIQTLDREKLAKKFADELNDDSVTKEFYVQVNTGDEEQKAGVAVKDAAEFVRFCSDELKLNVTGLMCIPPVEEHAFMHFGLLRSIATKFEDLNLNLSMGMSSDYLEAGEMGADLVRIGSAIFGARQY